MTKNNILLLVVTFVLYGCASYNPQYSVPVEELEKFPVNSKIANSFYLIGDVGLSPMGGLSDGLLALEAYLKEHPDHQDHLVFLGDNIYPTGMPAEGTDFRPLAENHLDAQIKVAKQFGGQTLFIPGNHDYYDENLENVKREKGYIETAMKDKSIWEPKVGCPIESKEISNDIQLIIIDSEWYLAKWDQIAEINDDCDQIKTREQFFEAVEHEFKVNQDKTIVVTLHHPIYTNGVHGGQYAAIKHLFPTQSSLPIPVLGSLVSLIRTSGGVSAQDKQNKRYQSLADRLSTIAIASTAPRIMFASGHEHTLQYIENSGVRQIVSGSGSKQSYAALSNDGLFSYGGRGFVRMDVLEDGSSWVRYFGYENGTYKLLYTKKAIDKPDNFDLNSLPDEFPAFAKASIYPKEEGEKSDIYEGLWGKKYRDIYSTEINAKVGLLDSLKGGLTVVRADGSEKTKSLRLVDKEGREYNLRAIKKNAFEILQTIVFKPEKPEESLDELSKADLLYDFSTAAHPYAALVVPELSQALDIYHVNTEVYYIPKQKALGKYNNNHGDELYLLVERPQKEYAEFSSYAGVSDVISTTDLFENLRKDEKYKVDQESYLRARMFDMLLGDWDRHKDQWRWAEFEVDKGQVVYKPIPRDRDQVFSNFDGAVFATLRTLIGITKQFATYDDNIRNVKWFNSGATYLDRSFSQESDREDWLEQAAFIQESLTDEIIEKAFLNLPAEIYPNETTASIIKDMKGRRDNLVDIADRYYDVLSKLAILTATDKDDIIEIERFAKNKTRVTIYRNKDGQKADVVVDRVFDRDETKEIWIYALDDPDQVIATGKANNPIKIRVIGGEDNDFYRIEEGRRITIHDQLSEPNTFIATEDAVKRLSSSYNVNTYDPKKNIETINTLTPAIGYNPDDGMRLGLQNTYTVNGFNRNPHTRVHQFTAGYFFATQGYSLSYYGEFAGIFNKMNLILEGRWDGPTFTENFFGYGNESNNPDDQEGYDFNRTRISRYVAAAGAVYRGEYGSNLRFKTTVSGIQVGRDNGRFIENFANTVQDNEFFDRKWYGDVNVTYNYTSNDNDLNPTRGMIFEINNGIIGNFQNIDDTFYYFKPKMGFYNALTRNRKWVLRTLAQAHVILGNSYEFYQSAQLGQNTGLRAYRTQRFSGERSFATSVDVRYSFTEFKTGFLPLQIGVFAGGDVGRVWQDNEGSTIWHNGYGGGIWVNSAQAIQGTFNLFQGEDGLRFSFQVGFNF